MPQNTSSLIDAIRRLLPACATEAKDKDGLIRPAVDFDLLRQELSDHLVEGQTERYQLNWPGKRRAMLAANEPCGKTLRPRRGQSVNLGASQNLFIEGDNLEALKLLQEIYLGRIKCIYIDPPYNTGKDFLYKDNFAISKRDWERQTGEKSAKGRLVANPDSGGRFHSNWLSMMWPRLKLARNLLAKNGVIFISIDDHEQHNLRKIMDEIFGAKNFVAKISWQGMDTIKNDAKHFSSNTEFIFVYAKEIAELEIPGFPKTEKQRRTYKNCDNDPRGDYLLTPIHAKTGTEESNYEFTFSNGQKWKAPAGCHPRFSQKNLKALDEDGRILLDPERKKTPQKKTYWSEASSTMRPTTFWPYKEYGSTRQANGELRNLLGRGMFENPKPVRLIEHLLRLGTRAREGEIVLDFFAGSCTTAHAVMKLNQEDGGNRRFIMVQLPEPYPENSEAFKAGFKTIADIGKARIARAAAQLGDNSGCKVFRLDESNFKAWDNAPPKDAKELQERLEMHVNHLNPKSGKEDIFYEILLKAGHPLTTQIEEKNMAGTKIYSVDDGKLFLCLEKITFAAVRAMAKAEPQEVICLDSCFAGNDELKTNAHYYFKSRCAVPEDYPEILFRTV